ncbi:MAG TPA: adenylate/guanylate cyclase domain-containing protein [Stellaceae bacterium]|nr:adenylate/guanylate cyclase domain-containing protein [Stellaceae bacterium]
MTTVASQPSQSESRWLAARGVIARILRSATLRALIGAQFVAVGVIVVRSYGWFQPVELLVYDTLRVAWAQQAPRDRVVLVGMTEADIKLWRYPLSDELLADLLERLASWHPRAIGVDIYRDIPVPPGTDRLTKVIERHPEIVWGFKLAEGGDKPRPGIPPPDPLVNTNRIALTDVAVDSGAVARRGLIFADDGVKNYPGLGMALALGYLAREGIRLGPGPGETLKLGKTLIAPLDEKSGPYVHLDSGGYQVLLEYYGGAQPFPRRTVADVMDDDRSVLVKDLVKDRVVLIGDMLESVKDFFATPFSTGFGSHDPAYGFEVHAHLTDQVIEQALTGAPPLAGFSRRGEDGWIWAWAMAGALLALRVRSTFMLVPGTGVGMAAIAAIVYFAFGRALLLPFLPGALAWVFAVALTNQLLYAATNRARARLRRSFEHYLPRTVIDQMVASDTLPQLGGERREISVLYTDVAGFTTFSEAMDPEALANLTNEYFEGICGAIWAQDGLVNTFIGDSVLAFFSAPLEQLDHADRAVAAGLAIARYTDRFSAEQKARGVPFGKTRIGVHTGIAFVGNVGARQKLHYTALGDTLNTGSRLEGLNKAIGTTICVSGDIVRKAVHHKCRRVGAFVVKGRREPTEVFEPIDEERYSADYVARYEAAFCALEAGEAGAAAQFAALHRDDPEDPCVAFHHRRLSAGESGIVVVMDEK